MCYQLCFGVAGCVVRQPVEPECTQHAVVQPSAAWHIRNHVWLSSAFYLQGVLYASPSSKDAPSMLLYSPFDSWAANSDWQMSLPEGEEATAAAAGQTFCAVATSRRMLRMFSQAGARLFTCSGHSSRQVQGC